ncbi:hypothetical protein CR513_11026, partial [Mucuna pruriens]
MICGLRTILVINVAKTREGITRSGHVYMPEYLKRKTPQKRSMLKCLQKQEKRKAKLLKKKWERKKFLRRKLQNFLNSSIKANMS